MQKQRLSEIRLTRRIRRLRKSYQRNPHVWEITNWYPDPDEPYAEMEFKLRGTPYEVEDLYEATAFVQRCVDACNASVPPYIKAQLRDVVKGLRHFQVLTDKEINAKVQKTTYQVRNAQ